jgi:hypothetical protein
VDWELSDLGYEWPMVIRSPEKQQIIQVLDWNTGWRTAAIKTNGSDDSFISVTGYELATLLPGDIPV